MSSLLIKTLLIKHGKVNLVNLFKIIQEPLAINTTLAIVGQSGSGKSLTLKTILNLLPNSLESKFSYECSFELNSTNIGFIPQNPFTSLSPLTKISKQFFCNQDTKIQMLKRVGLDIWVLDRFPMQLSGGQLQRVVIAIALSNNPKLLLLDEPTTALDNQSKKTILELLSSLQKELNILMIFVTHDISAVQNICEKIIVLKDGYIVENGYLNTILENPKDKYTQQLIDSSFKNRAFRV